MRNKYSTAHHTSYKSTVRGLVRLRALSNKGLMIWNCSRLVSLGYFLLRTSLLSMEASKDHEHVLRASLFWGVLDLRILAKTAACAYWICASRYCFCLRHLTLNSPDRPRTDILGYISSAA